MSTLYPAQQPFKFDGDPFGSETSMRAGVPGRDPGTFPTAALDGAPRDNGSSLFDGPHLRAEDHADLAKQLDRVRVVMADGIARTLEVIALLANVPVTTVGSRIRDLRKQPHGSHVIVTERRGEGRTFVYRMVI